MINEQDTTINNEFQVEQKESIKLIRGQRGSYGWEIKILSTDVGVLEILNNQMLQKFHNESKMEDSGKDN